MSEYICFLISIYYEPACSMIQCALKIKRNTLPGDCEEYPMDAKYTEWFHNLLPLHVKSCGPIIKIEEIFEIHCIGNNGDEQ